MENLADVDLPQKRILNDEQPCEKHSKTLSETGLEAHNFDLVNYLMGELDDDVQNESFRSSPSDISEKLDSGNSFETSGEDLSDEVPSIDSIDENDNEEN